MRLRGLAALALTTTACSAVIGLGEYTAVEEDEVLLDAGVETGAADSFVPTSDDDATVTARDAEAGTDAAIPIADAADAANDAEASVAPDAAPDAGVNRKGVRCIANESCGSNQVCCVVPGLTQGCVTPAQCSLYGQNLTFACDDDQDCSGEKVCCVTLDAQQRPKSSSCASPSACASRACLSDSDCTSYGDECRPPQKPVDNGVLPLLEICR